MAFSSRASSPALERHTQGQTSYMEHMGISDRTSLFVGCRRRRMGWCCLVSPGRMQRLEASLLSGDSVPLKSH